MYGGRQGQGPDALTPSRFTDLNLKRSCTQLLLSHGAQRRCGVPARAMARSSGSESLSSPVTSLAFTIRSLG